MIWPLVVGASILLNGFFAGMETGITSARRVRLVHWSRQGRRGARVAADLVTHRERSVVAAVVGNNVAIVAGTSLATAWAVARLGDRPTTRKLRVVARQQQILRLDWEEPRPLPADEARRLLDLLDVRERGRGDVDRGVGLVAEQHRVLERVLA